MHDKSIFQEMVTHLKVCIERFESEIREDLSRSFPYEIAMQQKIFIENAKHYHYTEILKHINVIKLQLESIMHHDQKLLYLHNNPSQEDYYSSMNSKTRLEEIQYVRKQVENFSLSSIGEVHQREKRPIRKHNESSMKYLTLWEQFLEKQKAENSELNSNLSKTNVVKRNMENGKRKHVKLVSSTYDAILDVESPTELKTMNQIEELSEECSQKVEVKNRGEREDFLRKRPNAEATNKNIRTKNDYFSDIFENCDDLIEIINRKSIECRRQTLQQNETISPKSVSQSTDKNYRNNSPEENIHSLCDISDLCHNISYCLNQSKKEVGLGSYVEDSSKQLGKTGEGKAATDTAKNPNEVSDIAADFESVSEKKAAKPRIVGVVFKKEAAAT